MHPATRRRRRIRIRRKHVPIILVRMWQEQLHGPLDLLRRLPHLLNELLLCLRFLLLLTLIVDRLVEVLDERLLEIDFGLATVVD